MTKQTLSFIIIGLVIVALGVYAAFTLSKKGPDAVVNKESMSILLYVDEGDVSYKTESMETFQKATSSPLTISNHTQVHTGLGRATILFPNNGSVTLDEYTELAVNYDEKNISLFQTLGSTYHRVEALIGGATYEVETPGTLAAVRGTKFAVTYNKKTKTTKVGVTEHTVAVSKLKAENGTSTREILESIMLEEGKTARVNANATTTGGKIDVVETKADADMRVWVDKNKKRDEAIDTVKKDSTLSKEEVHTELKVILSDDTPEETTPSEPEKKVETREETKPTSEPTTTSNPTPTSSPTPVIKKIDEEAFFDKFNNLFVSYFYLDEKDTPCTMQVTPAERTRVVTSYAYESGYGFSSKTLLDFATAIDTYCSNKDAATKLKLQARFDIEFPFQENI